MKSWRVQLKDLKLKIDKLEEEKNPNANGCIEKLKPYDKSWVYVCKTLIDVAYFKKISHGNLDRIQFFIET